MTKFAEGVAAYKNRTGIELKIGRVMNPYAKGYARKEWQRGHDLAKSMEFSA